MEGVGGQCGGKEKDQIYSLKILSMGGWVWAHEVRWEIG